MNFLEFVPPHSQGEPFLPSVQHVKVMIDPWDSHLPQWGHDQPTVVLSWTPGYEAAHQPHEAFQNAHRNNSGNAHIMSFAKISVSKNSMWAARPMNVFRFTPWEDMLKFTSHRMKTRWATEGDRIWSKQLFNISRNTFPFFEKSIEDAGQNSILAEWYGTYPSWEDSC